MSRTGPVHPPLSTSCARCSRDPHDSSTIPNDSKLMRVSNERSHRLIVSSWLGDKDVSIFRIFDIRWNVKYFVKIFSHDFEDECLSEISSKRIIILFLLFRENNRNCGSRWKKVGRIDNLVDYRNRRSISVIAAGRVAGALVFVSDKSSRASTVLAQCRTNLPSRTHDITTPAWRLVIYHPAANLHYVWRTVETVENTVHLALSDSYVEPVSRKCT